MCCIHYSVLVLGNPGNPSFSQAVSAGYNSSPIMQTPLVLGRRSTFCQNAYSNNDLIQIWLWVIGQPSYKHQTLLIDSSQLEIVEGSWHRIHEQLPFTIHGYGRDFPRTATGDTSLYIVRCVSISILHWWQWWVLRKCTLMQTTLQRFSPPFSKDL